MRRQSARRTRSFGIIPLVPFLGRGPHRHLRRGPRRHLGLAPDQHLDLIESGLASKRGSTLIDEADAALTEGRCDLAIVKYGHVNHLLGYLHAHRHASGQPERFQGKIDELDRDIGQLERRISKRCRPY